MKTVQMESTCCDVVAEAIKWAPSPLASFAEVGGFSVGDVAYLRVRVAGFVAEQDGTKTAMCQPIERSGKPCECGGERATYFCPVPHLVRAEVVTAEVKAVERKVGT